jgi:hypothetical protein
MTRICVLLIAILAFSVSLHAQGVPKAEAFVGISLLNKETGQLSRSWGMMGWQIGAAANVRHNLMLVGDFSKWALGWAAVTISGSLVAWQHAFSKRTGFLVDFKASGRPIMPG